MRVFVLLFNAGTDNEGIHTLQIGDRNKVLMFESEDDATRYALMLEAQDFPPASVESMDDREIKAFCESADYDWELVPEGALTLPPEGNVEETDWQIDDEFADDFDDELELTESEASDESQMSDAELEKIRRRLEGLL
ncbi:hypothetical protein NIES2119_17255 [[Phormidium ambiguum] IAM M-71]|uniref:DUF3110 domain-containing protein n=1 Tax=[Phormidium ambiguum] IAM M-71 TaxID=454136 RepID=A0A1U7IH10_9CYAN|nr:DUF3110 domain-containing protein [Phormidium ambiguum]OKH36392.1 hypothetical protein NIES2119_17255 [Phormidium ambiguum IAM M-71]